jgi:hypothetical protein
MRAGQGAQRAKPVAPETRSISVAFTVYKKSRPDRAIPDSAENLILFSYLETQGACSNLPR